MTDKRPVDELTIEELERILAVRKREARLDRLRRMEADGRLVDLPTHERPIPPPLPRPTLEPAGATTRYGATSIESEPAADTPGRLSVLLARLPTIHWRWIGNRFLFLIEVLALVGLLWIVWDTWQIRQDLNREANQVQREVVEQAFPTPKPTALIGPVVLPGGHTSPIGPGGARPGEAGGIPEHLLPLVQAYQPPPIPTPGPEQPRRIVISAIGVDHPVVEGDDPEQLKKGVGHHIGSANPGVRGNMVLTAHNDIYGEIFRRLDELQVGDEVIVYTLSRQYVYSIQSQRIVDPFEVSVLAPTRSPTLTLISCYPYLLDTERIVVIGVLKEEL